MLCVGLSELNFQTNADQSLIQHSPVKHSLEFSFLDFLIQIQL